MSDIRITMYRPSYKTGIDKGGSTLFERSPVEVITITLNRNNEVDNVLRKELVECLDRIAEKAGI